ncbi:hypothetical protein Sste5346_006481 [Sporothrix stenoceras]|uniref:Uncharacterized protein n=1 Tax=Sporothrix stenoceras TaxID=5173 RepID=A0ABR3YY45_9PEZI
MSGTPTNTGQPARRRFAPVPIETTFERFRKNGSQQAPAVPTAPAAELTPSPSPQSDTPPATLWTLDPTKLPARAKPEKRRFAPQLIESSRRSRRAGDIGPATRPTDKTDITPYHNHIYAPKHRKKHRKVQSLARRESCDEETAAHVFEMLAREAEKRFMEEAALAAFPNSRARAGGAEHFVIREGSDDDDSSEGQGRSRQQTGLEGAPHRTRRDSYTEDVGWALREMQEHHEQLVKVRGTSIASGSPYIAAGSKAQSTAAVTPDVTLPRPTQLDRVSTIDLDQMSIDSPPTDPIWTTTARQPTQDSTIQPIGENFMPYIPEEPLDLPGINEGFRGIPSYARKLREAEGDVDEDDEEDLLRQSATPAARPIGEVAMPYIPAASEKPATTTEVKFTPDMATQIPTETGFRGRNAYAGYRNRDLFASERDVHKLRKKSPPMLGKELVFPKCASPKQTKLEPEFLWSINDIVEKSHKGDGASGGGASTKVPGQPGLWHGLCIASDKTQAMVPLERPALLETPFPPSTPGDPFAHAFSLSEPGTVYAEPRPIGSSAAANGTQSAHGKTAGHHTEPKGLHMLAGLDERLRQEKAAAEIEENIQNEFTDRFVTQVYNYLSLGYPSMAWSYDDELSKISRISVEELGQDDGSGSFSASSDGDSNGTPEGFPTSPSAKGHISLDDDDRAAAAASPGSDTPSSNSSSYNHDSCPRWRALKIYIYEWARQHPDLNSISPLAWGVRERRGSWGV